MKNDLTVTFYSNFLLHHQTPFCEAMVKRLGENFHYVATEKIPEERINMGYHDYTRESYAINAYEDDEQYKRALDLAQTSDVVILGDAPNIYIEQRLKEGKLTFRYSERYFKKGKIRILDPRVLRSCYLNDIRYRKSNFHMLCASAYTAGDCRFIRSYLNKTYKWGYFPPVKEYENVQDILDRKKPNSILWVGRFLDWKRPIDAIKLATSLKKEGYAFTLTIIGEGDLKDKVVNEIAMRKLGDCVKVLPFTYPEKVREYMEEADIYLFTSDKNEGWGAVLNESMNSLCAVVANREIGSAPYLIKHNENGLIFNRKKKNDLTEKVKFLLDNKEQKRNMQLSAYKTLKETWNAESAADRLLGLIEDIQNGRESRWTDGPCSKD